MSKGGVPEKRIKLQLGNVEFMSVGHSNQKLWPKIDFKSALQRAKPKSKYILAQVNFFFMAITIFTVITINLMMIAIIFMITIIFIMFTNTQSEPQTWVQPCS